MKDKAITLKIKDNVIAPVCSHCSKYIFDKEPCPWELCPELSKVRRIKLLSLLKG